MRTLMRGTVLPALAVGALLLGACGDDDDGEATETDEGTEQTEPEQNLEPLTVCTDAPYAPFEFEDDDEVMTGFDMELLREIAGRIDMELQPEVTPFDGILLNLESGTCELVGSAMTITEEREEQALFTDSYFDADQSLLVKSDEADANATLEDLAGKKIGVQSETTGESYANDNKPEGTEVVSFGDADEMFLALESGEVDALLQDFPVNAYRALQDDTVTVTEVFQTNEAYGFAAAQDNQELVDSINEALQEIREDGTYDELYEEWFGEAPS